jgi:hypothetical protein
MKYDYVKVSYDLNRKARSLVQDKGWREPIKACKSLSYEKRQAIAILSGNPVMESKSLELSNGASDIDDIGELYAGTANTQNPRPNTGKSRGIANRKVASSARRVVMDKEMTAEKWDKMTDKQKARFCRKQVSNIRRKK